jgi:hypothetical protein
MSDIFGAVGQIAGASIQASAMKEATQMQIDALQKQRDFVYKELEPGSVNAQAQQADIQRAQNQLALQAKIDPALLAQRYASEGAIAKTAGDLASGNTPADQVAATAAKEGIAGVPGEDKAKAALIDAALKELSAGATLPPDVQAQLVQTGLEKTGQVTGTANASGIGGQNLRTVLGTAGINLKFQREQQAANLSSQAQQLEASRQQILGNLFPNLQNQQLKNISAQQGVLQQSNAMAPSVGLGGTDITNLWLARVGATNQLAQTAANAAATGAAQQGQIWGNAVANTAPYLGGPTASSLGSGAYQWAKGLVSGGDNPIY